LIKLKKDSKIQEISKNKDQKAEVSSPTSAATLRPEVVNAKVYKIKSAFVKNAVFITLSYIDTHAGRRPIEIFINSKDLSRSADYVVLTRLISAIFRRATNPMFILEELHGIQDPNGGSFKDGKYVLSFYSEVAYVIERFFYDVNIIDKDDVDDFQNKKNNKLESEKELVSIKNQESSEISDKQNSVNTTFKICPSCSEKGLKTENGCDMCMECGYSKCDK